MKKMYRTLLSVVAIVTLYGAVSAAEPIKAGVYPSYPPLDMRDPATNELTGFDLELGTALAAKLGRPLDWKETSYSELIAAVKTGRIEIFFNGMFDTPERQEQIGFVDYLRSGSQFITLASKPYRTPESLCGKKVGISRMTNAPAAMQRWSQQVCEKTGKPAAIYVPAENSVDARSQMTQGRTDAVMMDSLTIPYVIAQNRNAFVTVGDPIEYTSMGIGVAKGDATLQKQLAVALQSLVDDGSYAKLLKKWGLSPTSAITKVTINAMEAQK
ncbi:ABC transporter substrate-binding protein [Paraburkholderia sp. SIMBA_055]